MTQHRIIGSEAHLPLEHVEVRHIRRQRRGRPVAALFAAVVVIGPLAGLIDAAIGAPVLLTGLVLAMAFLWRRSR